MKIFFCLLFSMFFIITTACGQEQVQQIPEAVEIEKHEIEEETRTKINKDAKELNFTLWSWQLPSSKITEAYVEKIKNAGYTGIDFCVLWNKIEPVQNHFDWTYLDSIMNVFVENDLNISVSLLLWTKDLLWSDSFILQKTSNDIIYESNGNLCLNSSENLKIIKNTVQAFAYHCSKEYSAYITRWHIRTSDFGTIEYSPLSDLDYSDSAMQAFYDFINSKYESIEDFIDIYSLDIKTLEDLKNMDKKELTKACYYDWKLFRQQTLIDFVNFTSGIFKTANKDIPVAFQTGNFSDALAGYSRGTFDIYTAAKYSEADILHLSSINTDHLFSIDMLSSLTNKDIALQIDGAWQGEDIFNDYLAQAKMAGESNIKYLNTANWELEEIEKYSSSYLSKFEVLFFNAAQREEAAKDKAILVNTTDFILKTPPSGLYTQLGSSYSSLSGKNYRKVRFVSDTMLLENPELLASIQTLYLGTLDNIVYIDEMFAKLLLASDCLLAADNINELNFLNQYKKPLPEDIQDALRARISD